MADTVAASVSRASAPDVEHLVLRRVGDENEGDCRGRPPDVAGDEGAGKELRSN